MKLNGTMTLTAEERLAIINRMLDSTSPLAIQVMGDSIINDACRKGSDNAAVMKKAIIESVARIVDKKVKEHEGDISACIAIKIRESEDLIEKKAKSEVDRAVTAYIEKRALKTVNKTLYKRVNECCDRLLLAECDEALQQRINQIVSLYEKKLPAVSNDLINRLARFLNARYDEIVNGLNEELRKNRTEDKV